jgi:prevent-host-death family protein
MPGILTVFSSAAGRAVSVCGTDGYSFRHSLVLQQLWSVFEAKKHRRVIVRTEFLASTAIRRGIPQHAPLGRGFLTRRPALPCKLAKQLAYMAIMAKMVIEVIPMARLHGRTPAHHDRPPELDGPAISATAAKNEFGRILEKVIQGGKFVITKHDAPKAVLISIEEFHLLSNARAIEIETLHDEFDRLLEGMQAPASAAGMKAAYHATPKLLGKAAAAAARKRG